MNHLDLRSAVLGLGASCLLVQSAGPVAAQPAPASLPAIEVSAAATAPEGLIDLDLPAGAGSHLGLTPRQTPASIVVVERDAIEARGAQDTQEILRGIPGVTAHTAPGNIGVSYRGFGTGSISQMFNGIDVQYSIAARPVDSWIYDRVEAVGGPSSFLFGAGAVGGSINYITRLAERSDATELRLRLGTEQLKELSLGLNRRIAGDGSGAGDHHARIDINHRDAGNWIDGTATRATQFAASLRSDFGGGLRHTLAYEFQDEDVERPYWGTPLRNPIAGRLEVDEGTRFRNYNSADGIYAQRVQWLRSITQWSAGAALQLKNTFYAYDALRDYRNVEGYRFDAGNAVVIRSSAYLQRHDQRLVGDRIEGAYPGQLAGRRSEWAFGLDASVNRQTRFPNSLSGVIDTVDPYDFATERFFDIPGMAPGYRPDRDNKVTTIALYVENRTELTESLALITGLRHDRIRLDLVNRREVTASSPARFRRDYRPTTGRIGLVWDYAPGASAYVQYATAADPPSGVLSTASFADVRNNSELTRGRQMEIGTKLDFWHGRGSATVALYDIRRENIATQDPDDSNLTVLVGEQGSRGIEIAVGLQPTPRWSIRGDLAWVDAEYRNFNQGGVSLAGRTPANTPSTVANLWLGYAFSPALRASVGVRHVGKVYGDALNTAHWPSYTLVDLGLGYRINRHLSAELRLRNATDRVHATNLASTSAYLGPPRTADIALRASF